MTAQTTIPIEVAAAVVFHNDKILLAKRHGGYLHDLWEFPGGKLEADESAGCAARRELIEELRIKIVPENTLLILEHDYPDKRVRLHFVKCRLEEEPTDYFAAKIAQAHADWFAPDSIPLCDLCPADRIAALQIPWHEINITGEERND